jgi:hypothetical protein
MQYGIRFEKKVKHNIIALIFMVVRHKLLVEFSIIFLEKQWILKVLVAKPWLCYSIMDLVKDYSDLYELNCGASNSTFGTNGAKKC